MALKNHFLVFISAFAAAEDITQPRQLAEATDMPHASAISNYLNSATEELANISQTLWEHPELGYEEYMAHDLLTAFMESKEGWSVNKSIYGLDTAFSATFNGFGEGPVISFNSEYDALPNLGHACGHNLIATVGVGAALATAEVMRAQKLGGKVVLFGTPAEESLGGKVRLLERGAFHHANISVSLMAHPSVDDTPYFISQSTDRLTVTYKGRTSHAAAAPWDGINAQDALVLAYNAMGLLRQQSKPTDIVHGVINAGGPSINVIPNEATASFQIRSRDDMDLAPWSERLFKCFDAGALGTGAELNLTVWPNGYSNMVNNDVLAAAYAQYFEGPFNSGVELPDRVIDKLRAPGGSSDQGNVSWDFPSIQPMFGIYSKGGTAPTEGPHTAAFQVAAGTRESLDKAIVVAKSLAGVAVDLLTVEGRMDEVRKEFEQATAGKKELRAQRLKRNMRV